MNQTPESIEAQSALVRSQLLMVGADIRHRADPTAIVDAAKSSFKRRVEGAPTFLTENASPIGLVVLGGAFGAVLTGLFSRRRSPRAAAPSITVNAPSTDTTTPRTARSQVKAAVLSAVSVGLGYIAGMFVPTSSTEERLLGEPKALLRQHVDDFLKEHTRGMKTAVANLFGVSRFSATALVGLAMVVDALGRPRRSESQ